jgi:3-methyladenine DNA glycosylase/8-oxoguanine DNA glycosylase
VAELQRQFAGLRPALFYSPYEAAAWTIIGQRIRIVQAAVVKRRLTDELGSEGAFPAPGRLATIAAAQRGLTARKIDQLRALAEAAQAGTLTRDRLRELSFADITEPWHPHRSWCALLLRRWLEAETQEIATGCRATGDPPPIV